MLKIPKTNENEHTMIQNLWDMANADHGGSYSDTSLFLGNKKNIE